MENNTAQLVKEIYEQILYTGISALIITGAIAMLYLFITEGGI